jgi:alpha-D-ribose 1-methylphosphonate 5-triphosphate synthase subunit PhnH
MSTVTVTGGDIVGGPAPEEPIPGGSIRATSPASTPTTVTPGGAQAVFRATLDALARPGTVTRLPSAAAEPLAAHVPAALLPLLALADLSTPACVVDHPRSDNGTSVTAASLACGNEDQTAWDETVRVATNAPRAALGEARLVAALRPLSADELGRLCTGTAAAPEDGALACLAVLGIAIVDGVDADDPTGVTDVERGAAGPDGDGSSGSASGDGGRLWLRLSGPGVPGTRAIIVTGLPAGFAAARRRLVAGFPAGADLLLIAPDGAMAGLPRTTVLREAVFPRRAESWTPIRGLSLGAAREGRHPVSEETV